MLFEPDEIRRIEDAELFLLGASAIDLGYDVLPLQLSYDVLEIRSAQQHLEQGKLPNSQST